MHFGSDNVHGVHDAILDAIRDANSGVARAYGHDDWSARAEQRLRDVFECDLAAYLVVTGTAANSLALAACCPSHGSVVCHAEAHILTDECGAPELYTGGAKLVGVRTPLCMLTPEAVGGVLDRMADDEHVQRPSVLSLSQATELGTSYRPEDVSALAELARGRRMHVHMDGARFANALVRLGCSPAELTWKSGVDVLSFGATKNGALGVEAVVFFDTTLADDFLYRRKRSGQLVSKGRFLGAQMLAYLHDDLWLRSARHANAMADRLAAALGHMASVRLAIPLGANEVFAIVPVPWHERLKAHAGRGFEWHGEGPGIGSVGPDEIFIRLIASFKTTEADIAELVRVTTA